MKFPDISLEETEASMCQGWGGSECMFVGESRDRCWLLAIVRMLAFILNEKESYWSFDLSSDTIFVFKGSH